MNDNTQKHKWYVLTYQEVLGILNTSSNGLSSAEVKKRQKESGLIVLLVQVSFVYLPFTNQVFKSSPLYFDAWVLSAVGAFSILIIIGFEKWVRRKYF